MSSWRKASCPLLGALLLVILLPSAPAQDVTRLELTIRVSADGFNPATVFLPSFPTELNLTVLNEDSTLSATPTFTIFDGSTAVIDVNLVLNVPQPVNFTVHGPNTIEVAGANHTVDGSGGIRFASRTGGMEGMIFGPPEPAAMPYVYFSINATTKAGHTVFEPDTLRIPQYPARLHILVVNRDPFLHTLSFREGTDTINYEMPGLGDRVEIEIVVTAAGKVRIGDTDHEVEVERGGTRFFCLPHENAGMVGHIVVGEVSQDAQVENGVFLRAYWIGLVGIGATAALLMVSYFVIKGGSRHNRDNAAHVRRGLP